MRKFIIATLFIMVAFVVTPAQEMADKDSLDSLSKLARAPKEVDGLGRAVIVVMDEAGNPIKAASVHLHSYWGSPKEHCESWDFTNDNGATALLPIHMGELKLVVKMKGYQKIEIPVSADTLDAPVKVTLVKK